MNTCFAPDVVPEHLAALDGRGPFARFDETAVRGPTAAIRAGRLVGYTGWAHGHYPERLRAKDGTFFADKSATDGRATSGCHDPLPWLAACGDRFDSGLAEALCDATRAVLRTHMPVTPGAIDFCHHNKSPGWVFKADRGTVGHFAHIENALYLYLWTGDLAAREVWFNWLAAMRTAGKQFTACDRETHTHFVRCHLAAVHASDATYDIEANRLARLLISKPLAEHKEALYHPLWPYYLWRRLGKESEPWLVAAVDWAGPSSGTAGLVLAAIAYWITGKREYLSEKLPALVDWVDSYLRDPGGELDWLGVCTGRTGDFYSPNQWPVFKRAMLDAGFTDDDVPRFVADNCYPLCDRRVTIIGKDLSRGRVRYMSYGGDTNGGRLYALDENGKQLEQLVFEGPWKSNRGEAKYAFQTQPVTRMQALAYQQLLGPLTDDPTEAVIIEAGKAYELGRCRGILETSGAVTVEAVNEHVTFYDEDGRPLISLFAGYHNPGTVTPHTDSIDFDARGPAYLKWRFTCTAGGIWRVVR